MLRLKEFHDQLHVYFKVMTATDTFIEINYKGKIYKLNIEDTGKVAPKRTRKRGIKQKTLASKITSGKCPLCGSLAINGVCTTPARHPMNDKTA